MKFSITKKNISYFILTLFFCCCFFFFLFDKNFLALDLVLYTILFFVSVFFIRGKKLIRNYYKDLMQTVLIITVSYFILYYLLGVVVGFAYNTYDTSILGILSNTFFFLLPLLLREEVRQKFIYFHHSKFFCFFITVVFVSCELFGSTFFSFQSNQEFFLQVVSVFLPIVIENILLTYLAVVGIRSTVYAYFLPMLISRYYIPIVLDVDWFYSLLLQLLLSGIIYSFVQNEYLWKVKRIYSRKTDKKNSFFYALVCCFILFFGLFVAGFFKYQPVAILTYSMSPRFTRGDAVVIEKLKNSSEKRKLKKGDIIQYQYNDTVVVHRIIDSYLEDGEKFYILKGDNNKTKDLKPVSLEQIMGKVLFSIPKVGYPSVWLSEFLYPNREVEVEVGR